MYLKVFELALNIFYSCKHTPMNQFERLFINFNLWKSIAMILTKETKQVKPHTKLVRNKRGVFWKCFNDNNKQVSVLF